MQVMLVGFLIMNVNQLACKFDMNLGRKIARNANIREDKNDTEGDTDVEDSLSFAMKHNSCESNL